MTLMQRSKQLKVLIEGLRSRLHEQEEEAAPEGTDFTPQYPGEQEAMDLCLCHGCPTHPRDAAHQSPPEGAHCGFGVSNYAVDPRGCLCPSCDVFKQEGHLGWYFCTTGRAETSGSAPAEEAPPEDLPPEEAPPEAPPEEPPPAVAAAKKKAPLPPA
jgi:hypothetical protein